MRLSAFNDGQSTAVIFNNHVFNVLKLCRLASVQEAAAAYRVACADQLRVDVHVAPAARKELKRGLLAHPTLRGSLLTQTAKCRLWLGAKTPSSVAAGFPRLVAAPNLSPYKNNPAASLNSS